MTSRSIQRLNAIESLAEKLHDWRQDRVMKLTVTWQAIDVGSCDPEYELVPNVVIEFEKIAHG